MNTTALNSLDTIFEGFPALAKAATHALMWHLNYVDDGAALVAELRSALRAAGVKHLVIDGTDLLRDRAKPSTPAPQPLAPAVGSSWRHAGKQYVVTAVEGERALLRPINAEGVGRALRY